MSSSDAISLVVVVFQASSSYVSSPSLLVEPLDTHAAELPVQVPTGYHGIYRYLGRPEFRI